MTESGASILWTALPLELVVDGMVPGSEAPMEVSFQGRILQVIPAGDGMATVQRLISSNPQDYLQPQWQPGARIALYEAAEG